VHPFRVTVSFPRPSKEAAGHPRRHSWAGVDRTTLALRPRSKLKVEACEELFSGMHGPWLLLQF
jgi:hypothetical protein